MFEQGKEVCDYLSAICPLSFPTLTLSYVHALNDTAIVVEGHSCFPTQQ